MAAIAFANNFLQWLATTQEVPATYASNGWIEDEFSESGVWPWGTPGSISHAPRATTIALGEAYGGRIIGAPYTVGTTLITLATFNGRQNDVSYAGEPGWIRTCIMNITHLANVNNVTIHGGRNMIKNVSADDGTRPEYVPTVPAYRVAYSPAQPWHELTPAYPWLIPAGSPFPVEFPVPRVEPLPRMPDIVPGVQPERGPRPAPRPVPRPGEIPFPAPSPRPLPRPLPRPGARPNPVPAVQPVPHLTITPNRPPVMRQHPPRPPARNEREGKVRAFGKVGAVAWAIANAVTESCDFVNAAWDAVADSDKPQYVWYSGNKKTLSPRKMTCSAKAQWLFSNAGLIDPVQFAINLGIEGAVDLGVGTVGKKLRDAYRKANRDGYIHDRPFGYQAGAWDKPVWF